MTLNNLLTSGGTVHIPRPIPVCLSYILTRYAKLTSRSSRILFKADTKNIFSRHPASQWLDRRYVAVLPKSVVFLEGW